MKNILYVIAGAILAYAWIALFYVIVSNIVQNLKN